MSNEQIRDIFVYCANTDEVLWRIPELHRLDKPNLKTKRSFNCRMEGYNCKLGFISHLKIKQAFLPVKVVLK